MVNLVPAPRALVVGTLGEVPALAAFRVEQVATAAEAIAWLAGEADCDAVLLDGDGVACSAAELESLAATAALTVVLFDADAEHAQGWLRRGADEVLGRDELLGPAVARRLRFAALRRSRDEHRVHAYATDVHTGLPHRQQLVEHLSQLLALREREPAPMALLALRIEGLDEAAREVGPAEADALRRKVAVRLRAGVRASDLVAAVGAQSFVVLLGSILAPADAERVADKLCAALVAPFHVAGAERSVAVAIGISRFPDDGKVADRLVRRALALAEAAPLLGTHGPVTSRPPGAGDERTAANDDR